MNDILISIIVPVFNTEPWLTECLDSLFDQSLSYERYEVICINDGSTDKCPSILDTYAANHSNMRVLHQKNCGVSTAKNVGLNHAIGKYVWFVDSDDFIPKDILGEIADSLSNFETDELAILPTSFIDGEVVTRFTNVKPEEYDRGLKNYLTTRIILRESIEKNNLRFNVNISNQEDNVFYTILKHNLYHKIQLDRIGYFVRIRKGSLSHGGMTSERVVASFITGAIDMKTLYE